MSDLRDRLNVLAERGTKRGADAVLEAAQRKAAIGVIDGERDVDEADPIPFVTAEPTEFRRPRRKFGSLITAAGVSMMLLVGMLAMSALVGSGGAGSPEAAVRQLANAVSHEDPLAAAKVLAPNELRSLHATVDKAQRKAAEKELVASASAPLEGIDFSVDGVELTTTELADGFAKVTINSGTLSATTTKAKFSPLLQKAMNETEDGSADVDLANTNGELFGGMPSFVVAVREDGDWYVSAAYTALEYIREYNKLPAADYGSAVRDVATLGADSPDQAVQEALNALQRSDWDALIRLTPPDELPLYDYRAALVEWARQHDARTEFTLTESSTESEISGDTAKVTLNAKGTTESGAWSIDGGCYTTPDEGAVDFEGAPVPIRYCVPEVPASLYEVIWGPATTAEGPSEITAVERDGKWFVSPAGTALDVLEHWVEHVNDRTVYSLLDIPEAMPVDGTIRVGETITVPGTERGFYVYTFEGRKGQRLLAQVKADVDAMSPFTFYDYARLLEPQGQDVDASMFYGYPTELPADGTYRVVVPSLAGVDTSVTIWNEEDAPDEARAPEPNYDDYECPPGATRVETGDSSSGTLFCEASQELK